MSTNDMFKNTNNSHKSAIYDFSESAVEKPTWHSEPLCFKLQYGKVQIPFSENWKPCEVSLLHACMLFYILFYFYVSVCWVLGGSDAAQLLLTIQTWNMCLPAVCCCFCCSFLFFFPLDISSRVMYFRVIVLIWVWVAQSFLLVSCAIVLLLSDGQGLAASL